jgi:hypothetical protein
MRETIDMARKVYGAHTEWTESQLERLKQFEALVRADERKQVALDKKAENARELGLDYEPVPENFMDALKFDVAMRDAAPVQPETDSCGSGAGCLYKVAMIENLESEVERLKAAQHVIDRHNTTPPAARRQWVGLTDDERTEIRREHYARTLPLMDAVEAKLKEKNT